MNRTKRVECFPADGVADDGVVVANFVHPQRGPVRSAAAPVLLGALGRRGRTARTGTVRVADGDGVLFAATYLDRDGHAVGFGVAANRSDAAGVTAAREVVDEWQAVLRTRRVVVAATDPLCAGGHRAAAMLETALQQRSDVYVVGRPVLNRHAEAEFRRDGLTTVDDLDDVPESATVVFPAHGVSLVTRAEAGARGLRVVDATCPLVAAGHEDVRRFAGRGDTVVVLGPRDHAAGSTFVAQAPDEATFDLAGVADPDRVSFVVQPGAPVEDAVSLLAALRARYPRLRGQHPDRWCYAASDRAAEIRAAAAESDVTIIAGTCEGTEGAHPIEDVGELRAEWLTHAATVALVAGVSAPPGLVSALTDALSGLGPLSTVRRTVTTEVAAAVTPVPV